MNFLDQARGVTIGRRIVLARAETLAGRRLAFPRIAGRPVWPRPLAVRPPALGSLVALQEYRDGKRRAALREG